MFDAHISVHLTELIVGSHLNSSYHHRAVDEWATSTEESLRSFLTHNTGKCIDNTCVITTHLRRKCSIVGDTNKCHLSWATDNSSKS